MVEILDTQVWLGWVMIVALLYGLFPSLILGRLKRPLADRLHDKVLFADAKMNQADWLTAAPRSSGSSASASDFGGRTPRPRS